MKQKARNLRKHSTDAEHLLWQRLRNRQIDGFKFRRQEILGRYIVDFLCAECRLIIEADGGQHMTNEAYDAQRTRYLELSGYRVLRFWNHDILNETDAVLEQIYMHLKQPSPRPSP